MIALLLLLVTVWMVYQFSLLRGGEWVTRHRKQWLFQPIIGYHPVSMPHTRAYNPALLDSLLVFRYDDPAGNNLRRLWTNKRAYLGVTTLNERFQISSNHTIRHPSLYAPEDPRIITCGDETLLFFNDLVGPVRQMFCATLVERAGNYALENLQQLHYPSSSPKVEKNWAPFLWQDQLLVVYSTQPHIVCRIDRAKGQCIPWTCSPFITDWAWGALRGGTPPLMLPNGSFLSFFHSAVVTRQYPKKRFWFFAGAYLFQGEPPFAVTRITPTPLMHDSFYRSSVALQKQVVFPTSLGMRGAQLLMGYGHHDRNIAFLTIDSQKLVDQMVPVQQGPAQRTVLDNHVHEPGTQ